jgi:hypothetical protein
MPTIEVRSQITLDDLLQGVKQLDAPDLEQFYLQISALRARRFAPVLSREETTLLRQINQGLSPQEQLIYDELTAKRRANAITANEREELFRFIERIEEIDAGRIQALGRLALLRGVSVPELMAELGITRREYA